MAGENTLELLIKLISDVTGAKPTQDEIDQIKKSLGEMGEKGEEAHNQLDDASERVSGRMHRRSQLAILGILGIHGPITTAIGHLEHLQYTADMAGLSLGKLFASVAPSIAAIAGATAVVSRAIGLAKEADEAWAGAGKQAQGFWNNLAAGYGVKEIAPVSATISFHELGLKEIENHLKQLQTLFDQYTHHETVVEKVWDQVKDEENALAKRQGDADTFAAAADKIRNALAKSATEPGEIYTAADVAAVSKEGTQADIRKRVEQRLKMFTDAQHEALQGLPEARAALRARREDLLREALYGEEEEKAKLANLRGNAEEASRIGATLARARKEGILPGTSRYEELTAGAEGKSKAEKEAEEARQTFGPPDKSRPLPMPLSPGEKIARQTLSRVESMPEVDAAGRDRAIKEGMQDILRAYDGNHRATMEALKALADKFRDKERENKEIWDYIKNLRH